MNEIHTDCVVLEGVRMEFIDLKGVRVELLLVLDGVRVELLLLGGEGGTDYLARDEGGTGLLAKPLRKTKTTSLILLPFKIETRAVMTRMFLLVPIGI